MIIFLLKDNNLRVVTLNFKEALKLAVKNVDVWIDIGEPGDDLYHILNISNPASFDSLYDNMTCSDEWRTGPFPNSDKDEPAIFCENATFIIAIEFMKMGYRIRRPSWDNETSIYKYGLYLKGEMILNGHFHEIFSIEDVISNDWVVITK